MVKDLGVILLLIFLIFIFLEMRKARANPSNVPKEEFPATKQEDVIREYFGQGYSRVQPNGYDSIAFGTDKKTVKRALKKKGEVQEPPHVLLYEVIELPECDLATSLTFIQERVFVSARVFVMCKKSTMPFNAQGLADEIVSRITKDHGTAWEKREDDKSDGYYVSWKTETSYLGLAYTPGRKHKDLPVPLELSVYWRTGTNDEAYWNEMRSQYGF